MLAARLRELAPEFRRGPRGHGPPSANGSRALPLAHVHAFDDAKRKMSRFTLSLRRIEHACDGIRNLLPARPLGFQLLFARSRQPVNPDALLVFRKLPVRADPF